MSPTASFLSTQGGVGGEGAGCCLHPDPQLAVPAKGLLLTTRTAAHGQALWPFVL